MSLLELDNVHSYYGHIHALKGISLTVEEGEVVTLIGANGAGKSTTLKSISTLLGAERGEVTKGSVAYRGERTDQVKQSYQCRFHGESWGFTGTEAARRVRRGALDGTRTQQRMNPSCSSQGLGGWVGGHRSTGVCCRDVDRDVAASPRTLAVIGSGLQPPGQARGTAVPQNWPYGSSASLAPREPF